MTVCNHVMYVVTYVLPEVFSTGTHLIASQGQREAVSLLGNWLGQARKRIQKKNSTQQTLKLSWFRFDKHVRQTHVHGQTLNGSTYVKQEALQTQCQKFSRMS